MKVLIENSQITMTGVLFFFGIVYILDKAFVYCIDRATKRDRVSYSELIQLVKKLFKP